MLNNAKIISPWYEFRKKVNALFERDPDIIVGEICENRDGQTNYNMDIEVRNHAKFLALDQVLPKVKTFGNVTLGITLYDEQNNLKGDNGIDAFKTIFDGNPIVKDIRIAQDLTGTMHGFVRFRPEVIQFFADNLSDYNGNWSGLAQDIARELFDDVAGIHFCTAGVNESDNEMMWE